MTRDLLIDVGNTQVKWTVWSASEGIGATERAERDVEILAQKLMPLVSANQTRAAVVSVADDAYTASLVAMLKRLGVLVRVAESTAGCCGIVNAYEEPERLGVDRWIAMIAGWHRVQGPVCVIDAGTAVTVDLLDGTGQHEGGYIFASAELMTRALLGHTDRIRFEGHSEVGLQPGRSTRDCVLSGARLAVMSAVSRVIVEHPNHSVLVTGGGAPTLIADGVPGQHVPTLLFEGLVIYLENGLD